MRSQYQYGGVTTSYPSAVLLCVALIQMYGVQIQYKQPTPAEALLVLRSKVDKIKIFEGPGRKATVQVQLTLSKLSPGGKESLLASAQGTYKKVGSLRAF